MALLEGIWAKYPCDEGDDDQPAGLSCRPKWCCRNHPQHDEKYDVIFKLLKRAEEHSKWMEMHVEENKREVFKQAQKALDSYNMLLEWIIHAIVNIGGSNNMLK